MEQNPYYNLFLKLKNKWKDEDINKQTKIVRENLFKTFLLIVESNPKMDHTALNYFSLQELNVIRICMNKTFKEFLEYFTKLNHKDNRHLKYFIFKISQRGKKINIKNKNYARIFFNMRKAILIKLNLMLNTRKRKTYEIQRIFLKANGLGKYFKSMQKIGDKFSNRIEIDASEFYCFKLVNE